MMELAKAPWIKPGVVVHEAGAAVDELLYGFARDLKQRGFDVRGLVQLNNNRSDILGEGCAAQISLLDIGSGQTVSVERDDELSGPLGLDAVERSLRAAMRDDVDLVVLSRFSAFEKAATRLGGMLQQGLSSGLPVLTSIAGRCVGKWHAVAGADGMLLNADRQSLWKWWGPERLYQDLALGIAEDPVRQIACGPRWIMVEGLHGCGLAYLPRNPSTLLGQMPHLRKQSLRELAQLAQSWDPLEMALGIAAINAHYNRYDLAVGEGNGVRRFSAETGRVVVIGAFPGRQEILPQAMVVETDPRPGEYPIVAIDTLLPGSAAVVVSSSTLVNRNLPRVLRLAAGARLALIGPTTPLSPRLHDYGCDILGGFQVRDPAGLAALVEKGGLPRDFDRFGRYVHLCREDAAVRSRQGAAAVGQTGAAAVGQAGTLRPRGLPPLREPAGERHRQSLSLR